MGIKYAKNYEIHHFFFLDKYEILLIKIHIQAHWSYLGKSKSRDSNTTQGMPGQQKSRCTNNMIYRPISLYLYVFFSL